MTSQPSIARVVLVGLCAAGAACGSSPSATQPSSGASTSGVTSSVSIPEPVSPAANAQIAYPDQPVTVVVRNAAVQGSAAATYTFEVATDAGFANKVVTRTGVPAAAGGQTSAVLDHLGGGADYYWRAHAEAGGAIGASSTVSKFSIGSAVTIDAPESLGPANGSSAGPRPLLRVKNATRQGPAGAITYRFEIATSDDFTTLVVNATVAEGTTETDFTPVGDLATNATFYWRATAIDQANGASSAPSPVRSFTTAQASAAEAIAARQGVVLWSGAPPPGVSGHARMSGGWEVESRVSYDGVPFLNPPIEALRLFDLMDRGLDPDSAISWLSGHGYPSTGQYYAGIEVIGIPHVYLALVDGAWELVLRAGG